MERDGAGELMGGGDRDLRTILKVQLSPGNNRKTVKSFHVENKSED